MRKLLLFAFLVLTMTYVAYGQDSIEHLTFQSITIDGNIDEFTARLKKIGWNDGYYIMKSDDSLEHIAQSRIKENDIDERCMIGEIYGQRAWLSITYSLKSRLVHGIKAKVVEKGYKTLSAIKPAYDSYVKNMETIYGKASSFANFPENLEVPCNPNDTISTLILNKNGFITIAINVNEYNNGYICLNFVDLRNFMYYMKESVDESEKKETVKEICGIPFGTSYKEAKSMLENKYGYQHYNLGDRNIITYKHKNYAGVVFDTIHFLFQSDGINSFLNGCVFILDANTQKEAIEKQNILHDILAKKYTMVSNIDENGFKYYIGGMSPISKDDFGFMINIIKYNKDIARQSNPYAVRLMYGTYNYVKEEF